MEVDDDEQEDEDEEDEDEEDDDDEDNESDIPSECKFYCWQHAQHAPCQVRRGDNHITRDSNYCFLTIYTKVDWSRIR